VEENIPSLEGMEQDIEKQQKYARASKTKTGLVLFSVEGKCPKYSMNWLHDKRLSNQNSPSVQSMLLFPLPWDQ
jgi:hypothetical protein